MSITTQSSSTPPKYLQENDLPQECKDVLLSLPKEKGWAEPHLYKYQGFWYPAWQFHGVLQCQRYFQAQETDILLVSSPKCGTTWLKALAFTIINRKIHPPNAYHPLNSITPHQLVPCLELELGTSTQSNKTLDPTSFAYNSLRILSTHLPFISLPDSVKDSGSKIVYICRNPKDTFISLWHFMNNLRNPLVIPSTGDHNSISLEEAFDMFCKGVSLFGPYWNHVLEYWKKSKERPNQVLFLNYEDLKSKPFIHLRRLAEFVKCPFSLEEETACLVDEIVSLCSFENLSNLEVNKKGKLPSGVENRAFFRKGSGGDWKDHLSNQMIDTLNQLTDDRFQGSGLVL